MAELVMLVAGLVVAGGLLWKAYDSREQYAWYLLGAFGWMILALSGITDGWVDIGITVLALCLFVITVFLRRRPTNQDTDTTI